MAARTKEIALPLVDPATNENYKIIVSAEDAQRAGQDLVFATRLFHQAKLQAAAAAKQAANAGVPIVSSIVAPANAPSTTNLHHCLYAAEAGSSTPESLAQTVNDCDENEDAGCIWTKPMGLLLIRTYKEKESNFTSGKMSQKQAWERISEVMASHGYKVSGTKCASKFSSLKRTYKAVKDHNKTSGNERRTWYFLDVMDELFSTKPWIDPVSTASSDSHNKSDSESSSTSIGIQNSSLHPTNLKRKRSKDSLMAQLIEEKKKYREEKQRQHEDKIREARRLSCILEKLLATTSARLSESMPDFDEDHISD